MSAYSKLLSIFIILTNLLSGYSSFAEDINVKKYEDETKELERLAQSGDASRLYLLGWHYAFTGPEPRDFSSALKRFNEASEKGFAPAMEAIGQIFLLKNPPDIISAQDWFTKAADLGDLQAMSQLAKLYWGKKDYIKSRHWLQIAADGGHPDAILNLAVLQAKGLGGVKDCLSARKNLEKSLSTGLRVEAINSIIELFRKGISMGNVTMIAKEWINGGATINTGGGSSICGTPGSSGVIRIELESSRNTKFDLSTKGADVK